MKNTLSKSHVFLFALFLSAPTIIISAKKPRRPYRPHKVRFEENKPSLPENLSNQNTPQQKMRLDTVLENFQKAFRREEPSLECLTDIFKNKGFLFLPTIWTPNQSLAEFFKNH